MKGSEMIKSRKFVMGLTVAGTLAVSLFGAANALAQTTQPNHGRAENLGRVVGSIAGAAAGAAVTPPTSRLAGAAANAAAQSAGAAAGAAAGRYLDKQAEANAKSGRGGPNDPRYDPLTLFGR
jgi:hypothetical protein